MKNNQENQVFINVIKLLESWGEEYEIIEHEPVWTCELMARYCNCKESEILKSVVLEDSSHRLWVYVLPGDHKVESRLLRKRLGVKNISFANKERAEEMCGCDIGCIPPFGHAASFPVVVHEQVFNHEYGFLSPGLHDKSVRIRTDALRRMEGVKIIQP